MSEQTTTPDLAQNGSQPGVRLQILTQYIRDLSFENAVAQRGMPAGEVQPEISVQVSLDALQGNPDVAQEQLFRRLRGWLDKHGGGAK